MILILRQIPAVLIHNGYLPPSNPIGNVVSMKEIHKKPKNFKDYSWIICADFKVI